MQYKYKVCKGQKVLALSTTLREAEQEARRVGGVVLAIGSKRRNPLDPTSTDTYVPQGKLIGAEFFYKFSQEAGIPSYKQTIGKMLILYSRLLDRGYLYPPADGLWEVEKDIPIQAFFEAARAMGLLAPSKSTSKQEEREWKGRGDTVTVAELERRLAPSGEDYDLYSKYVMLSKNKLGAAYHIAHAVREALNAAGHVDVTGHYANVTKPITFTQLRTTIKQVLDAKLAEIGPERIKRERVRFAGEKVLIEQMNAEKQAHEGADKFPLRPVGAPESLTPKDSSASPAAGMRYLATLLAPKCSAPVAYFLEDRSVFGYSPDLTRYYTEGYFDGSEENADGLPRVHMGGLENYSDDKGKGIGPLAYIAMPFAALVRYSINAVFSPQQSGGPRDYISRSKDAHRAWSNLRKAGLAVAEVEAGNEYTSETIDLNYVLEAGSAPLSDWSSVDRIDPHYVEVEGEKEGGEITVDVMSLRNVLMDERTLHVSDNLWRKIDNEGLIDDNDAISPPAVAWAEIDMLHCTPDEVERMVEFCSKHRGIEQEEYLREVAGVIGTNPTYRKGTLDNLLKRFGLEVKTQNPRRRKNPDDAAWLRRNKQAFWDAPDANKQAGQEPEAKKNPKASKKLSANQQKKYLGTLKGAAREARASEILHRREHRSNAPFKTDKGQQTKKSSHAVKFAQKYGRAPHDVADAARLAKVSERVLNEVYARGMAAWQTGHRPGASQHAWAMARVESFLTGGPTSKTADADLARKLR